MAKAEILIKQTRTKSGLQCQRWDSQSPHTHIFAENQRFPDKNLEDAASFCRCPQRTSYCHPWCYTLDSETRREECEMGKLQQGSPYIYDMGTVSL